MNAKKAGLPIIDMQQYPAGMVSFEPANSLVRHLFGREALTAARVIRPGDSGPVLQIYYLDVGINELKGLQDEAVEQLARDLSVDESEIRKAVRTL